MVLTAPEASANEVQTKEIGREIFSKISGQRPSIFRVDWWQGQAMEWAMRDETFKVQLFRFVDVFPTLRTADEVARHLQEYFDHPSGDLPAALRWGLKAATPGHATTGIAAKAIGRNIHLMAERFIAGSNARDALPTLLKLRKQRMAFTLDVLGEASLSAAEALEYQRRYLDLLRDLPREVAAWPADPLLDVAPWGPLPRVNVSLKTTSLYSQIDPIDFDGSREALVERLRPLFQVAAAAGVFMNLDLEQFRYRDLTYAVFEQLLMEEEFRDYPHFGIVVQAYLRDAERDLRRVVELARRRGTPLTIRLVKGAYWDYETVTANQQHWPVPVFTSKDDTDAAFEHLTRLLVAEHDVVHCALGTHNIRSMAAALAAVRTAGLPDSTLEFQMLHGMAESVKQALVSLGFRLREYTPVGAVVPGMAYLVRRLLENTANESFLRRTFVEGADRERLLSAPLPTPDLGAIPPTRLDVHPTDAAAPAPFKNTACADFSREADRARMEAALTRVRSSLGVHRLLLIGGREVDTSAAITSVNPAAPRQVLGTTACARAVEAEEALIAASRAFPGWRDTPPGKRAEVLFRAADLTRRRRFELAALEILEGGKTWREADADVAEAIDFLEYYGREMHRLGSPRHLSDVPGETDTLFYEPRGVAAVIAPWNFPLAILAGMTSAALVAGNVVIMKPANPTPLVAWELANIFREAGLPDGVLSYLPGPGSEVGAFLVKHPQVDVVAFTGSRATGLDILREAGIVRPGQRNVKRVIAEMGGKNAVIVDADADVDAAVDGVLSSAFGFSGQKCSACSRVVVVGDLYQDFVERLVRAASSIRVGDPALPGTRMGPLIDAAALRKVARYIEVGCSEAELAWGSEAPPGDGYFVAPHIFVDVPPRSIIAQEEIFGPVLAIMRAPGFDEAVEVALDSDYALTGGIYSRSPRNIRRAYRDFRVGNLYVNRGITGALVGRQPFGGSRMSGVGSKAGGPDYLLQFMEPRVVTENALRRGFAPTADDLTAAS
ncbi:MAG TPA: L-glutamate gamma-semialdehyde dehydrogenase [Thermoleophilia bacterium]|nr:L-glutamate gamma-semialdehyde dehydrogenase [Thermoleophilia bacterium]